MPCSVKMSYDDGDRVRDLLEGPILFIYLFLGENDVKLATTDCYCFASYREKTKVCTL